MNVLKSSSPRRPCVPISCGSLADKVLYGYVPVLLLVPVGVLDVLETDHAALGASLAAALVDLYSVREKSSGAECARD